MTNSEPGGIAFFGPYTLNFQERSLTRGGEIVPLGARALDILINLVVRAGEIVNRHELIDLVWKDVVVEEANLRAQLTTLRRALGDGEDGNRYILNIPGQGYSFVCPVSRSHSPSPKPFVDGRGHSNARLPPPIDKLIGRDLTVSTLMETLLSNRFVSIVGAGGIGKTTVALTVAEQFQRDNGDAPVYFVDLSSVSLDDDALTAIATALGCAIKSTSAEVAIVSFLATKSALLVLDSCEHVIDAAANIAGTVFREASGIRILATSREPLRADGETVHILSPLEVPPEASVSALEARNFSAVQLFMERAEASGYEEELHDTDVQYVVAICQQLDGLALAIELAASRVGSFGIRGTAELLSEGGELQIKGRRSALPRHQTLMAMLDWSVIFSQRPIGSYCWNCPFLQASSPLRRRTVSLEKTEILTQASDPPSAPWWKNLWYSSPRLMGLSIFACWTLPVRMRHQSSETRGAIQRSREDMQPILASYFAQRLKIVLSWTLGL